MTQHKTFFRAALLLPAALAAAATSLQAQDVVRLSFEEALQRAEKVNVDVMIGRESVQQAIEAKIRARGDLLPNVDLNASQSRSQSAAGTTGNSFSTRLVGSLTLVDAQRIANYNVQKVGEQAARTTFEQGVQTVLDSVGTLYFNHLRNLRRLELFKANIERAEVLLKLANSQVSAGVATQIDVTRAEAALATQQQNLLQQQTVVFNSEQILKRAIEIPEEATLEIAEFSAARSIDPSLLSISGSSVLDKRLDFRAQAQQLEQNKLEVKAAKWQRAPSISLNASAGLGSDVFWEGYDDSWSVGISANVPIFDGFKIESNSRLAASRVRSTELRLNNLQRTINDEVRFALRNAQSRLSQITVAEKNAALAAEELRLARIRFEQGVADNREIVDAQNNLASANDNLVDAVYQYNLARLELARVRGDVKLLVAEKS